MEIRIVYDPNSIKRAIKIYSSYRPLYDLNIGEKYKIC